MRFQLILSSVLFLGAMMPYGANAADSGASQELLVVANKGARTLGIVDVQAGKQLAEIPENGITGHEVIASPDGKTAYVPIYGNSGVGKPGTDGRTMDVFDLGQRKLIGSVDFGHGVRPHCPMFRPKNGLLYVTTELDETISIIDPKSPKNCGFSANRSTRIAYACHQS